jgi:hypothetical protein
MTPRSQRRDLGHPSVVLDLWRWLSVLYLFGNPYQKIGSGSLPDRSILTGAAMRRRVLKSKSR